MLYSIVAIGIVVLIVILVILLIYSRRLEVTEYEVTSSRLPQVADGLDFVLLADLHNNTFGKNNEQLIHEIDCIAPKFILIAGDMMIGDEYGKYLVPYHLITTLAKKYPIYYGYGNHEQRALEHEKSDRDKFEKVPGEFMDLQEYKDKLVACGVHLLNNTSQIFMVDEKTPITITGCTIDLNYFNRFKRPTMSDEYLEYCIGKAKEDKYQILIAHNPMYFDWYSKWGADLVVSGHVHGGIVRLPYLGGVISPQFHLFPKYDAGQFVKQVCDHTSQMIVSRGLGAHTLKMRLHNRPELAHVILKKMN